MSSISLNVFEFPSDPPIQPFPVFVNQFRSPSRGFTELSLARRLIFAHDAIRHLAPLNPPLLESATNSELREALDKLLDLISLFVRVSIAFFSI